MKERISLAAVVLALAGLLVAKTQADFVLWNDEKLTVNTSHEEGLLYDQSQASIVSGGSVSRLYAHGSSTANISGGSVNELEAHKSSLVNLSSGSVHILDAFASSTVDISGGSIGNGIYAHDNTTVNVSDGSVEVLWAFDNCTADISGGSVVFASEGSSVVEISGGSVSHMEAGGNSTVYISGGSLGSIVAWDYSTVVFTASNFHLSSGMSFIGDRITGEGHLSGEWADGTRWAVEIGINTAYILAVPITRDSGDANGDGVVGDDDLSLLLASWGLETDWDHGEFSGTPPVNDDDLSLLLANWTGTSTVPEPMTLAILALGVLVLRPRRR